MQTEQTKNGDGRFDFEPVPADQIEVHWQHPRTELELPLLLVWPHPSINEWAAVVENGIATVVCHEWLYEKEIEVETDDGEIETETEIEKRAEEWGEDEAIPAHVAEALLEYDGEYGPVHEVRNPYSLESDDSDTEPAVDESQQTLTDGGTTVDESATETAETFVDGTQLLPHPVSGAVPIYDGHPPDTHLPMWRCHNCGETSPTLLEFWRADRNRDRLTREREEYEYGSEMWDAYNEGVHHYRDRIAQLYSALSAEIASWVSDEVLSRDGRFFEPYPGDASLGSENESENESEADSQ